MKANLEYEEYIIPKPEPEQDEDEIFPGLSLANMAQFIRDDMVERGDPDAQNPVLNIHVFDLVIIFVNCAFLYCDFAVNIDFHADGDATKPPYGYKSRCSSSKWSWVL